MSEVVAPAMASVVQSTPAASSNANPPAAATPATQAIKADSKGAPTRGPDGKFQGTPAKSDVPATGKIDDGKPSAEQKAEMKRLIKLVVDGQAEELDLDNPEHLAKLTKDAQLGRSSTKRYEEAKKLKEEGLTHRQAVARAIELFKTDPATAANKLAEMGVDTRKMAEAILKPLLQKQLDADEEASLTPEQKEARELKRKLAEYEKRDAEAKSAEEKRQAEEKTKAQQAQVLKHRQTLEAQIQQAMDAADLPKTEETALEVVSVMRETLERGLPVEPSQIAKDVRARLAAQHAALFEKVDDVALLKLLPKSVQDRVNKAAVEAYKKSNPMASSPAPQSGKQQQTQPVKTKKLPSSLNARFARVGMDFLNQQGQK